MKSKMEKLVIKELYKNTENYINKEVTLEGWVRTVRDSKTFGFIEINDGTFFKNVQIVFTDKLSNFNEICKLTISSSIKVNGTLVKTENAKQPFEIQATNVEIESLSDSTYPLQKKKHSFEYLRTIAHLRPRANTFNAVFRVRSSLAYAIHQFFQERGFVYVNTPLITGSDAEGAGEMFNVNSFDLTNLPKTDDGKIDFSKDFFGKSAHLTVSGQLNGETFAEAFRNIYTFGPTFRAENSNTPRHAAEFWMMEPEIAFADLNDDMALAEDMLKYIISYLMEHCASELEFFNTRIDKTLFDRLNNILNNDFGRVTYSDAVDILKKSGEKFEYPVEWGMDLQTEHERYLTEKVFERPVFVTDWPREIKAFYMRLNDDGKTVAAMDLLVPGVGELIGGSQREERLDYLLDAFERFGLKEEDYWWYLELRKYGGTRHAGFGLGFERLIMYVTGISNIRDVESYPRTAGNAEF